MFSAIHETDQSTAVSHSAFGHFLPGPGRQLITVCLKTLRIYRFNPYARYVDEEDQEWKEGLKLECIYKVELLTPVKSMSVAQIPIKQNVDSLILVFDQAKIATVYFDNVKFAFETISLHDFEDEELRDGFKTDEILPKVCVDPQQRCAVTLIYGRHLSILPFNESHTIRSYTVSLKKIDPKLNNIIDVAFLHGYYEPTLLIVYEPIQATPGRATVRYDTVSILAVSLNIKDRVHAVVWNVGGLPTTINQCFSMPTPIGGACLFGDNEVIYLNQAVPPCGLALNSDADEFTRFPFAAETKTLHMTLDGCVAEVLSENEILIVSRNGELYLLSLNVDISSAVKQMRMQKVSDVNLPYTLTICYPGYVFLGSKLGDSMLLHYTREVVQQENGSQRNQEDVQMDEDDLYLYSSKPNVAKEIVSVQKSENLKFTVVDSFLNTAPCKVLRVANATDVQAEFQNDSKDIFFDLVTTAGHERNSSLCFFQRTVRPFVQSSIEVDNPLEMFTLNRHNEQLPRYLFLAMEMSTNVFEFKKSTVDALDRPIFSTHETTVLVGKLKNGEIVVQITPINIILVGPNQSNDEKLTTHRINTNFPISSASIVDPYIAMVTQNGRLLLYKVEYSPSVHLQQITVDGLVESSGDKGSISAISIYKDLSGLPQICVTERQLNLNSINRTETKVKVEPGVQMEADLDDIDAMLYGSDDRQKPTEKPTALEVPIDDADEEPAQVQDVIGCDVANPSDVTSSYYLLITRENGNFYIYSLSDMQLVYRVKKLTDLPELLIHTPMTAADYEESTMEINPNPQQDFYTKQGNIGVKAEDIIMEVRLNGLGYNNAKPVLSILVDDIVWFYELYVYNEGHKGSLMVRFRKLGFSVITRSTRFMTPQGKNPVQATRDIGRRRSFVSTYERIGALSNGLFITGNYPCLLAVTHGEFVLHPFIIDGPISSLSTYNDARCRNGIIYLRAEKSAVRIAYLNPDIRYESSYPVRRIRFNETVRFAVFLLRWDLFVLITCKPVTHDKLVIVTNEDKLNETYGRDPNYVLPEMDKFTLQLFSTSNWSFIPNRELEFEEFETVTCCEEVLLNSESTLWGLQSYLAAGTAYNYGEEVFVRGRILIYEVIEVVPEENMPTTRHKLKCVYDKEQKGPVTSMCHCNGFLLTGMGQKIFIWQFRDGQLNGVSFLDVHFYVHSLIGFRSLALACDMFRSVSLIRYQEDHKVLSLVSRDMRPFTPSPMSAQFLLDRQHLAFALSDENGNVSIFSYVPESTESRGGENLILLGSLNIGSAANGIVRVNGHAHGPFLEATDTIQEVQTNVMCTLDGSWAVLRPINERAFRRLQILQQLMASQVPQTAGLNPRGCRAAKPQKLLQQPKSANRAIIDGNFVFQFMNLSTATKSELARASGSNRYQIMDDITEFRRACTHF